MNLVSLFARMLAAALAVQAAGAADDATAAYERGVALVAGKNVPADPAAARQAFEEAASKGHAGAAVHLGLIFSKGTGVPRDDAMALQWFSRAAASGSREGLHNKGLFLLEGRGAERDLDAALAAFEEAAKSGFIPSHVKLAELYYFGVEGLPKDHLRALPHAQAAAAKGDAWACNLMGTMAEYGYAMEADRNIARSFYTQAAEQGNAKAQANLGKLLIEGRPTDQEKVFAYAWLKLAARQGQSVGINLLALQDRTLKPEIRLRGEKEFEQLSRLIAARKSR